MATTAATLAAWSAVSFAATPTTPTQLPRTVRPDHYEVSIVPDAGALEFQGRVTIDLEVLEPTDRITLNALDLTFTKVALSGGAGSPAIPAPSMRTDALEQTATFAFGQALPRGSYRLAMDYSGKIGTQAVGIFAMDYDTARGRKRALYTQFENSDARRLIPCWDEPAYKATFTLEATVPQGEMAVSNMPVAEKTELGAGRTRVRFARSPKMSTYLLFFALGDFERATARADATEVGVITKRGATDQAAFALQSSQAVLHEYNDYFDTPYPLPKLDNVAAPGRSQFFGAMENWGAIFTFEYALLLDPSISTPADKKSVFTIAAHEISHQWFGDLVTMHWWDDLWLNEGFASWMEGRTTEKLHPEWNTSLAAVTSRDKAMSRDALATTHPVVQHVETVEQASQAFDAITYDKGKAVLRMLENYVGADAWRDGVRRYMKKYAYGNTVSDDLWREVEAGAGTPITDIAHDFTLLPGVPMIMVEDAVCAAGQTTVTLKQGEFSKDQPGKKPLAWRVPVMARTLGGGAPVRALVSGGRATLTVPGCGTLVVNAGQAGYYRTLYAPAQFARMLTSFPSLASIDQLGIVSDTWALGLAGLQPASDVLELARVTPLDADPQVWGAIAETFEALDDYYTGEPRRRVTFRKAAIAWLSPVFAKAGWTARAGELDTVAILRNELISTLGALGDEKVIAEARRRYAAQTTDEGAIPGPLRKAILGVVARHADAKTWDALHAAALAEKTPIVKDKLYSLLASTEDETLARRALELALLPEPGATSSAEMISTVAALHPDLAFDFAVAHKAAVNERIDATSKSRYYPRLASRSADPGMIGKVRSYAAANLAAGSRRDAETAAANVTDRVRVRTERLPQIDAWLAHNQG